MLRNLITMMIGHASSCPPFDRFVEGQFGRIPGRHVGTVRTYLEARGVDATIRREKQRVVNIYFLLKERFDVTHVKFAAATEEFEKGGAAIVGTAP